MRPYQMGLSGQQYITGQGMRAGESMGRQEDAQAALAAKEKAAEASMWGSLAGIGGEIAAVSLI